MEAKLVAALPAGDEWQYEPKFDCFRCLAFKDGGEVDLRSKSGQPFNRYFPEVVAALAEVPAQRFVLDGELVVPEGDALSFEQLLMRIHPAASRVEKLAREQPALFVVFRPAGRRRRQGARRPAARRTPRNAPALRESLSPAQSTLQARAANPSREAADDWLHALGTGLDGVMA